MKILLSAYACEPNKGSEPGVGWHWAHEIEKLGHQVCVLTRLNNKAAIENYYKYTPMPDGLRFIYYDIPKLLSWWKKGGRGVHLYYFLWQIGIFSTAKKLNRDESFDLVHHCTFVSVRQPSFLGKLGIPFVFGPVAGGECIPARLRKDLGIKTRFREALRDIVNKLVLYDPFMNFTLKTASRIYVTSEETKALLPNRYKKKAYIQLAIGNDTELNSTSTIKVSAKKFLFVGNFLPLKGMRYGLQAFAQVAAKHNDISLTMVGRGSGKSALMCLAKELRIENKLNWVDWVTQDELKSIYKSHDALLFPSLRDSGGMVVLEAMSFGLPVVCVALGGPGVIVNESCGVAVNSLNIVDNLSNGISTFIDQPFKFRELSIGAISRSQNFTWEKTDKVEALKSAL